MSSNMCKLRKHKREDLAVTAICNIDIGTITYFLDITFIKCYS